MKYSLRLLLLLFVLTALAGISPDADAARHFQFQVDRCNSAVYKLYQWEKVYEVVFASGWKKNGKVEYSPHCLTTDDRHLYVCYFGGSEVLVTLSLLKDPRKVVSTCVSDISRVLAENECTFGEVKTVRKYDADKLLLLCSLRRPKEKSRMSLIILVDMKLRSSRVFPVEGDYSPAQLFDGNVCAYLLSYDNNLLLTVHPGKQTVSTSRVNFRGRNIQASPEGKSWWIIDETSRELIHYSPISGIETRVLLDVPRVEGCETNGFYLWNREPFIFFKTGMVFQVVHTFSDSEGIRTNVLKTLVFYDYETCEFRHVGPKYVDGYYLGFRPRSDGYMIFSRESSLKQLYVYKFNREHLVEYRRNFGYVDGSGRNAQVAISDYCYLFESENRISTYSPNAKFFMLMKRVY